MPLEGVVDNCKAYLGNYTSFTLGSDPNRTYYLEAVPGLVNGHFVRINPSLSNPDPLAKTLRIKDLEVFDSEGGKLLFTYTTDKFVVR